MYFTREDILKILHGLSKVAVKDSLFPVAKMPINNNDIITMVLEGKNVKIRIIDFLEQLHLISLDDFLNVSVKFDETALSITQAARLIPARSRKIGLVITFENEEGNWEIWQYNSHNLTQWNNPEAWENIKVPINSIAVPDEEDLTLVEKNDRSIVKLKDREYNPLDYSGLGRKYLRKNIISVVDPITKLTVTKNVLTLRMLNKENTIYIILYDYDLNGLTIVVPEGCTLRFEGGSFSNGVVNLNKAYIDGRGLDCIIKNPFNDLIKISTFIKVGSSPKYNSTLFNNLLTEGIGIEVDVDSLEFEDPLQVKSKIVMFSNGTPASLSFKGKGITWTTPVYSNYNRVENLIITSEGNSFDFKNDNVTFPRNVYHSIFKDLRVISKSGHCFYAGNAKNVDNSDTMVFDNKFDNITVTALNGYGFVGCGNTTTYFEKIKSGSCKAVFCNVSGYFNSFNGTWGNTPTFYKFDREMAGNSSVRYRCIFINCNLESFTRVLFDCNDSKAYFHMLFHSCSFYVDGKNGPIDFYPFDFHHLYNLCLSSCALNYYGDGSYKDGFCLFRINALSNSKIESNISLTVRNNNNICSIPVNTIGAAHIYQSEFNLVYVPHLDRQLIDVLINKYTIETPTEVIWNSNALLLPLSRQILLKSEVDVEVLVKEIHYISNGSIMLNYFSLGNFIVKNGSTHTVFKFKHNLSYISRLFSPDGNDILLYPGEVIYLTLSYASNGNIKPWFMKKHPSLEVIPKLPSNGAEGLILKIVSGVPTWVDPA